MLGVSALCCAVRVVTVLLLIISSVGRNFTLLQASWILHLNTISATSTSFHYIEENYFYRLLVMLLLYYILQGYIAWRNALAKLKMVLGGIRPGMFPYFC